MLFKVISRSTDVSKLSFWDRSEPFSCENLLWANSLMHCRGILNRFSSIFKEPMHCEYFFMVLVMNCLLFRLIWLNFMWQFVRNKLKGSQKEDYSLFFTNSNIYFSWLWRLDKFYADFKINSKDFQIFLSDILALGILFEDSLPVFQINEQFSINTLGRINVQEFFLKRCQEIFGMK